MQCEDNGNVEEVDLKNIIKIQCKFLKQFEWLINLSVNDCLLNEKQFGQLKQKINTLNLEQVKNYALSLSVIKNKTKKEDQISSNPKINTEKGMSQKKSYQISTFTNKIQETFPKALSIMVDVGCGQGYLCENLEKIFHHQKLKIIGIDCNNTLIETATKQSPIQSTVEYRSQTFSSTFKLLLNENTQNYGLISLHGCGLLFQSIVDNFLQNSNCKYFASVSCCYNLIPNEKFRTRSQQGKLYFPNSIIIRSFLMIACQCVDTWQLNKQKTQNSYKNTIFRIVLQKLLYDYKMQIPQRIGKINTKSIYQFQEYFKAVLKTGNIKTQLQIDKIDLKYYQQLCNIHQKFMKKLWTIRGWVGYVIQSFIATDRILHLREQKGIKSQIISLFNRNISARNICIIGQKLDKQQKQEDIQKNS